VPIPTVRRRTMLLAIAHPFFPRYSGGGARIGSLIDYFQMRGWTVDVALCPVGNAPPADFSVMESRVNHFRVHVPIPGELAFVRTGDPDAWCPDSFASLVADLCSEREPDVLLVQRVFLTKCFAVLPPNVRPLKVLDADNLYTDRKLLFEPISRPYESFSASREGEVLALSRADLVMAIQEDEAAAMRAMVPGKRVVVVPYAVDAKLSGGSRGTDLLLVGNRTLTNLDGIVRFLGEAWPGIRRAIPTARLLIAGQLGEAIRHEIALPPDGSVEVFGIVADLEPLYRRASIVINPQLVGTGMSAKSLDALARGKCLVTTPAGGRGIAVIDECAVTVPSIRDFVPAIVELLRDPSKRADFEHRARRSARQRYTPQRVYGELEAEIEGLVRRGLSHGANAAALSR
jgi:glycosyltransferase involved in cell wall biosynthesis